MSSAVCGDREEVLESLKIKEMGENEWSRGI